MTAVRHFGSTRIPEARGGCAALVARLAQRAVLRTSRGPIRGVWGLAYDAVARACALWLTGADRRTTAYAARGPGPESTLYGVSDIDLVLVVPPDPDTPGRARQRILDRYERLRSLLPWLCETVLDRPIVLEPGDLADGTAASAITFGLSAEGNNGQPQASVYFGARSHADRVRVHELPGLRGPAGGWRRLTGPKLQLPMPPDQRSDLRIAAWLEIQTWWRWFLQDCSRPERPSSAYLCVKIVAEPARVWLALRHGEQATSRRDALERALRHLPGEEALGRALELERALPRRPPAPKAEFLRYLVRLSDLIAGVLADEVAGTLTTGVHLDWRPDEKLALRPNALAPVESLVDRPQDVVRPLADWRALARACLRAGRMIGAAAADETIVPLDLDPAELEQLLVALAAGSHGPYPALRSGSVLVLSSVRWPRTQLRAVHCELDDPVSFALLRDDHVARYPNVPGWSAIDTARRAVAEHRAWLTEPRPQFGGGRELGMLITAMRAGLFRQSLDDGQPELTLTIAGTLRRLRSYLPATATIADEGEGAYRRWRSEGVEPDERIVKAMRTFVTQLPVYR